MHFAGHSRYGDFVAAADQNRTVKDGIDDVGLALHPVVGQHLVVAEQVIVPSKDQHGRRFGLGYFFGHHNKGFAPVVIDVNWSAPCIPADPIAVRILSDLRAPRRIPAHLPSRQLATCFLFWRRGDQLLRLKVRLLFWRWRRLILGLSRVRERDRVHVLLVGRTQREMIAPARGSHDHTGRHATVEWLDDKMGLLSWSFAGDYRFDAPA